jgi:alkanesulfonate monooxygenase SsuD/methylene tetrahydromethanopterin reductase-like flavin-dependent oxidoreductase (luciferase family)
MNFGLVLPVEHPPDRDPSRCLDDVCRLAARAESLGFDSAWVGEHHVTENVFFDNLQILSHVAARTESLTLGTAVCLVPLYHPVRLAERVANLDVLAGGRFVLGAGLGYRPTEFDALGVDRSRRVPRLVEGLEIARRLWTEDRVSYHGEEFAVEGVSMNPKPVQSGGPPVWVGGEAPRAVRRALDLGDAWFVGPATRFETVERAYAGVVAEHPDPPAARPVWREVFVADSAAEARRLAGEAVAGKYDAYRDWEIDTGGVDAGGFEELADGRFLFGTPESVADRIAAYRDAVGLDHLLVRMHWPGLDLEVTERSLERFADEVMGQV